MRCIVFTTLFFSLLLANTYSSGHPLKHVIGSRPAGLFSNFFGVLNHLKWCEDNNRIPVVYWTTDSYYYVPNGYNGSRNVWEYYFEPVSHLSYSPGNYIHISYQSPDMEMFVPSKGCLFDQKGRKEAKRLIDRYIKIKPNVQRRIDILFKDYMEGKHTIGIHFRGTDKAYEIKPIAPEEIINAANKYAMEHPEKKYQFLVASDEQQLIDLAKKMLRGRVLYYRAQRSIDGKPIHYRNFHPARLGEEVLMEVQLLSRCDVFMHTISNVSCAVTLFNPNLQCICLGNECVSG